MYLKKLNLSGFKSFADLTEFHFHRGTTAVVGPNGCGKSNVVDAFRWVLGERSAKELRGSEMLDVIFKGAGNREPLSRAEVSLVFDNEDGSLAIDHSEVQVTRRLYRSGESEYLINGRKCRLKDLLGLFADTGVGSHGYSVLEQGNVDGFLHANPVERRIIFEEAAGISRYKKQKVQTTRQLERTEANLVRLQDIFGEVERRIRSVKIQAGKARRYLEDKDIVQKLRAIIADRDIGEFRAEREELSFELVLADVRRQSMSNLKAHVEEQNEAAREAVEEARERLTALRQNEMEIRVGIERVEQRRAHLAEQKIALEEGLRRRSEQRSELRVVESEYDQRRQETRGLLRAEISRLRELREELATAESRRDELVRNRDELGARLQEAKDQALTCLYDETKANNEQSSLESDLRGVLALAERREVELEEFQAELTEQQQNSVQFQAELEELQSQQSESEEQAAALRTEVAERTGQLSDANRDLTARRERFTRDQSRLKFLEGLEESREGIGRGVQRLLDSEAPLARDVVGLLADVIEADAESAPMVDAVLGNLEETVLFLGGTRVDARARVLRALLEGDGLRFCPMESVRRASEKHTTPLPDDALISRISFDPAYAGLLRELFGDVSVATDLTAAIESASRLGNDRRYVTPDGCLIESWGAVSLPSRSDTRLVSRRTEMQALRVDLALQEGELATAAERGARLERAIEERREQAQHCEEEARRRQLEAENLSRKLGELEKLGTRTRERIATVEGELAELARTRAEIEEKQVEVTARLERLRARRAELERETSGGDEELDRIGGEVDEQEGEVSRFRLAATQREERMVSLRREEVRLRGEMQERQSRMTRLDAEDEEARERIDTSDAEDTSCQQKREELCQELTELERAAVAENEEVDRLEAERRESAQLARRIHEEDDNLRSRRETLLLRENEIGVRMNNLREKLQEELDVELSEAPLDEWLSEFREADVELAKTDDLEEGEAEQAEAKFWQRLRDDLEKAAERLRKNSNVNLEAVDELTELEERFGFLTTQIEDLQTSRESLLETIESLNERCREMFLTTFAQVRENYQELFQTMFGGGTSDLRLEEDVDPLDAGIEVVARPPGKKISSLKLLSGGEKALTAISVLFALFRTKPSPFCILDEVDAPLDEANVRRFVRALKEFIDDTQFLIVTHNKVTMSKAERLYGITMQERGVSRQISVEIEQVEELGLVEPPATSSRVEIPEPVSETIRIPAPDVSGGTAPGQEEDLLVSGTPEAPLE